MTCSVAGVIIQANPCIQFNSSANPSRHTLEHKISWLLVLKVSPGGSLLMDQGTAPTPLMSMQSR